MEKKTSKRPITPSEVQLLANEIEDRIAGRLTDEECDEIIRVAAVKGEYFTRECLRELEKFDVEISPVALELFGYRNGQK